MSLQTDLDALEASAKVITDGEAAAVDTLQKLSVLVGDLRSASTDPATALRIEAVAKALNASAPLLGAAIVAGTLAANPPVQPPAPPAPPAPPVTPDPAPPVDPVKPADPATPPVDPVKPADPATPPAA